MRIKELSAGLVAPLRHSEWGVLASAEPDLRCGLDLHAHRRTRERVERAPAKAARLCDKRVQMWATAKTELYRNR